MRRARAGREESIGDRPGEERPCRTDDVLTRVPATAAVGPSKCAGRAVTLQRLHVGRRDRVQRPVTPHLDHPCPVGAVGAARRRARRRLNPRQVLRHRRRRRHLGRRSQQVLDADAELGQQRVCRRDAAGIDGHRRAPRRSTRRADGPPERGHARSGCPGRRRRPAVQVNHGRNRPAIGPPPAPRVRPDSPPPGGRSRNHRTPPPRRPQPHRHDHPAARTTPVTGSAPRTGPKHPTEPDPATPTRNPPRLAMPASAASPPPTAPQGKHAGSQAAPTPRPSARHALHPTRSTSPHRSSSAHPDGPCPGNTKGQAFNERPDN